MTRVPLTPKVMELLRAQYFLDHSDATEAHWKTCREKLTSDAGTAATEAISRYLELVGRDASDLADDEDLLADATEQGADAFHKRTQ
jgi:hypothetical protein